MLFTGITTEKSVDLLKRRIMKDETLYGEVLRIRKKLTDPKRHTTPFGIYSPYIGGARKMPTNAELLFLYKELIEKGEETESAEVLDILRKLKVRSDSGVAVVSLLTKPYACPGRCIYCPTEKGMPKSYLSKEPAAARAQMNHFDPYKQVTTRLEALSMNGHPIDKVEMILIGGTWSFYKPDYQDEFVSECFRACNNFGLPEDLKKKKGENTLPELQKENETAKVRLIGLSIETRPDYINEEELANLRRLGVTKVEIGVQHLDQKVLDLNRRNMDRETIIKATELMRSVGLKVVYHMMPNLPGSTPEMDVAMFEELFSGPDFQPDMLKVYPCVVLRKSLLYKIWARGGYKPYTDTELIETLAKCEEKIPAYVRVIRMIRDIPATYIIASSKKSNMRQMVDEYQKKRGFVQREIRAREVRGAVINPADYELSVIEYETGSGKEVFLSFDDDKENRLAAFLRLRLPSASAGRPLNFEFKAEELKPLRGAAIVRELHTYGKLIPLDEKGTQSQHMGFGRRLLQEAEKRAKAAGFGKVAIISGVGAREYYRKNGYELEGTYMVKKI